MHRTSQLNNLTDVQPTQLVQSFGCTKIGGGNYLLADNDGNQPKLCPIEGPWSTIALWYTMLMWKSLKIVQFMVCGWDSLLLLCLILLPQGLVCFNFLGSWGSCFLLRGVEISQRASDGKRKAGMFRIPDFWIILSDLKTQLTWMCVANVLA